MADRIQLRRDTAANWTSANPVLAQGELGIETDTLKIKAGNGTSAWSALSYLINTGGYVNITDIGVSVQAYDADLGAIAALAGTSGFLKKTAANTWSLDTSTYLTGNQSISVSGDATGSGTTSIALTLANSGVTAGTYNNVATEVRPFTVDAKGRVTSIGTAVTIAPAFSSVTGKPTTLAGYGITDAQALDADLTAIAALAGTSGLLKKTAANTWTLDTATYLTGNQSISVSGDATGSGTTAIALTLANSGVTAGTYNNSATQVTPLTVDAKGRVTATGTAVTITPAFSSITSKPTTLSGYGITDAAPLASPAFTGTATFAIARPTALQETRVAIAASDIDLSLGNYFTRTISGTTTLTVSNTASAGTVSAFVLDLTNGGSATVNWFSGVKWAGGTAPTLTSSGRDVLGFFTHDGGTTWNGFVLGRDVK